MTECESCDGTGRIADHDDGQCQDCGGSGEREETWEEFETAVHHGWKDLDDIFNRLVATEARLSGYRAAVRGIVSHCVRWVRGGKVELCGQEARGRSQAAHVIIVDVLNRGGHGIDPTDLEETNDS